MTNISENLQNSQEPLVSVNLVVYNGEKYIRQCLDSVLRQTYKNIEINILDNASIDKTLEIIKLGIARPSQPKLLRRSRRNWKTCPEYIEGLEIPNFSLIESKKNWGTWPGQEELLKYSRGEYIVALSVDIILHPNFIKNAIEVMERDRQIGALQAKVYKFELPQLETGNPGRPLDSGLGWKLETKTIDTCGFEAFKSRRIVNMGHGQEDKGQFGQEAEIFAVEGAVPVLRRQALEDCRLKSQGDKIIDPDFFWYGDDLDLAWRMRLLGWKQVFVPTAIAYHDRQTTKALAGGSWQEFIKIRKNVPMFKRRLDWRNTTFTIIKNDFASNFLCDSYYILWRQLRLWGYFLLFEPSMFLEIFKVAKMLPKMLKRRGEIMRRARVSAKEMRKWFK